MTKNSQHLTLRVIADTEELKQSAAIIADQLAERLCSDSQAAKSVQLLDESSQTQSDLLLTVAQRPEYSHFILILTISSLQPALSLDIDFNGKRLQYRKIRGGGKNQELVRAIGLHKQSNLRILDATAGLGTDSFVLACQRGKITLIEQHPVLALLIDNALQRASEVSGLKEITQNMRLLSNDSLALLQDNNICEQFDVIYLDPMYPAKRKSAKVKKEMQVIQYLNQNISNQAEPMLEAALNSGVKRIVVKRPAQAKSLSDIKPQAMIESSNTRYDIYLQGSYELKSC